MDIGLAIYASREVNSDVISEISEDLKKKYKNINFGKGILSIYVGVICVSTDFEPFFIPRKPKYTNKKKEKEIDGIKYVVEKSLEYDCKIDFESYQNSDDLNRKKLIAQGILNTTKEVFEKKKIKDFNEAEFIKDLEGFFKEQGYLD